MERSVHFVDVMLGMTIVMGQVFMAMDFWRGKKRSRIRKVQILLLAHGLGFWLVITHQWEWLRFGSAVLLLLVMLGTRARAKKNPVGFLLRVTGMGIVLAAEIIFDVGKKLLPSGAGFHFVLQLSGTALLAAGVVIAIAARKYLGHQLAIAGNQSRTEVVVDGGPFGLVRHPLYAGAFLVTIGLGVVMRSIFVLAGGALLVALPLHLTALREEKELLRAQVGYERYFQIVQNRYFPWAQLKHTVVYTLGLLRPTPAKGGKT